MSIAGEDIELLDRYASLSMVSPSAPGLSSGRCHCCGRSSSVTTTPPGPRSGPEAEVRETTVDEGLASRDDVVDAPSDVLWVDRDRDRVRGSEANTCRRAVVVSNDGANRTTQSLGRRCGHRGTDHELDRPDVSVPAPTTPAARPRLSDEVAVDVPDVVDVARRPSAPRPGGRLASELISAPPSWCGVMAGTSSGPPAGSPWER